MNRELIRDAMKLQAMLESRATGGEDWDETEYQNLRQKFISKKSINRYTPDFLFNCRTLDQFWNYVKRPKFSTYDERRQFLQESFNPLLTHLEREKTVPSDEGISRTICELSWDAVNETWVKILERRENDPEGALTASKTLLEDVCKCILDEKDIPYSVPISLSNLYGKASKEIGIHPTQQSEGSIKKLVGLGISVSSIISEFINDYGDSHGKGKNKIKPDPHYVEFAINLSGTMAKLLVEKWDENNSS